MNHLLISSVLESLRLGESVDNVVEYVKLIGLHHKSYRLLDELYAGRSWQSFIERHPNDFMDIRSNPEWSNELERTWQAAPRYSDNNEPAAVGYVYVMKNTRNGLHKIGFSIDPTRRSQTLQSEEPEVELVYTRQGTFADERELHREFKESRVRGEWFKLTDAELSVIYNKNKEDSL